jgi:N-acetylglucosamine-6-sulfatase
MHEQEPPQRNTSGSEINQRKSIRVRGLFRPDLFLVASLSLLGCTKGGTNIVPSDGDAAVDGGHDDAGIGSDGGRPNIVLILTDDQDAASFPFMPKLQDLVVTQGAFLPRFFASTPLCCPSRASILRGQYVHGHGVVTNKPPGGYVAFRPLEVSTIATWLAASGYNTALFGKYLNGYPDRDEPGAVPKTYVPPGWTEWASPVDGTEYNNFNYILNENGTLVTYGNDESDYLTDVLAAKAVDFIERRAPEAEPFFLYLATYAPHVSYASGGSVQIPPIPAPRHADLFSDVDAPRPPSFSEDDVSDKPASIRNRPLLNQAAIDKIDANYRNRLRSLQAVDEMVERVIQALEAKGVLGETYVFYTSDNGWMQGEHRVPSGKLLVYEESTRVSLAARGPGIPAGITLPHLGSNVDLGWTFAELAGATPDTPPDGRSLMPALRNEVSPEDWRQCLLLEWIYAGEDDADGQSARTYRALRGQNLKYVEYGTGERELYLLESDPFELSNRTSVESAGWLDALSARLSGLATCSGESCRSAENESLPTP